MMFYHTFDKNCEKRNVKWAFLFLSVNDDYMVV